MGKTWCSKLEKANAQRSGHTCHTGSSQRRPKVRTSHKLGPALVTNSVWLLSSRESLAARRRSALILLSGFPNVNNLLCVNPIGRQTCCEDQRAMAVFDEESLIIAGITLLSLFACCSLTGVYLYSRFAGKGALDKFLLRNQRNSQLAPGQRVSRTSQVDRVSRTSALSPTSRLQGGNHVTTIQVGPAGGAVDKDLERWKRHIEHKESIERATEGSLSNKQMKKYLERKAQRDAKAAAEDEAEAKIPRGFGYSSTVAAVRKTPIIDTYSAKSHHGHAHLALSGSSGHDHSCSNHSADA